MVTTIVLSESDFVLNFSYNCRYDGRYTVSVPACTLKHMDTYPLSRIVYVSLFFVLVVVG